MKTILRILLAALCAIVWLGATAITVSSPRALVTVDFTLSAQGQPTYQ